MRVPRTSPSCVSASEATGVVSVTLALALACTRPYRPQTNGKVERYHRTLADEWAYARPYQSETERRTALDPWLHTYNHHRGLTALGGLPPASRVTNLSGQNT
jgi:Integrase core domain